MTFSLTQVIVTFLAGAVTATGDGLAEGVGVVTAATTVDDGVGVGVGVGSGGISNLTFIFGAE